ncbi:hypothetical protein CROQUDRAFT_46431 [Cronartium quercuum f. sp. fusiforme G11]|uniref:Major facilitator superfamily (MFS) profile domain-containing protein n=1 Tax=Cronartium quercuum f. sp. fusiforme G11 TaxID=708437 RepID=A0A9P6TA94_9BASI|nr:hypothetical protein CROQUDRAFT_46431 [Cronartium quercuum f. sp. fusiforme G11]
MVGMIKNIVANLPRLPTKEERLANKAESPWTICRRLSCMHWFYFFVGFSAWVMDAFDFFAVSVTLTRLRAQFEGRSINDLSTAITLTLLFRSVGAISFGIVTDRYGRRWPLAFNLICISLLALGTGLVQTYSQFLTVRALFGIMMGGIYGMAAATALENLPSAARGLFSGFLQQGYAVGYLIAASTNLSLVDHTHNWRSIFYLGAGLSFFIAILRILCPESKLFQKAREEALKHPDPTGRSASTIYFQSLKTALKLHWRRFVFAVMLMTGFNFFSHGSQDLYPTYAQVTKGMSIHDSSLLTIIGNCGAIAGGSMAGWLSQFLGRRLTIILMALWAACFIPLWILPNTFAGLAAGAFFLQFGVQGAWGVIPIYLSEISPPAFRAIFTGLTYQLGNMVSSASPQIEARAGDSHKITNSSGTIDDYAFVQGVLIGVVAGYIIILISLGQEYRGRKFEEEPTAIETHNVNETTPSATSGPDLKLEEVKEKEVV